MFKTRNGLFKRILCLFLAVYLILSSMSYGIIDAEAHDAYFYGVTWDSDSCRYIGNIQFQSNSLIGDNHAETAITCDFYKVYTLNKRPFIDYNSDSTEDFTDFYKGEGYSKDSSFDNDKELLFTFPGYHTKGFLTAKLDANGSDEILAERINNTVLVGLNNCIDFICEQAGQRRTDVKNIRTLASYLGTRIKTSYQNASGSSSGSFPWGGTMVSYTYGNSTLPASAKIKEEDIPNGFTPEDYVEIKVNGKAACFIYQCWKGYNYPKSGGDCTNLQSQVPDKYKDESARDSANGNWYSSVGSGSAFKIGWDAIILQAHYNKDVLGIEFSNVAEIMPSNALTAAVGTLLNAILNGIRSMLGLYGFDELMLNKGARGMGYSLGLFPNGWVGPIYLLFTICLMIVWGVMGFAVVKIFMKRSLATISIGEKVSMMAELKNLAVCCFLLGAFPLVFNMMARINYSLVELFGSSTQFSSLIKSFYTVSLGNIGSFFASFVGLALQIYFNFFYVLRAITLAILYGIAPLAIYTIVLGCKSSKIFGAWSKEILSNIFVQTLHAMMIAFFTSVSAVSGLKTFESLVVLYSFIPLTKFVKQNVFQASDGIGGSAGSLASMATGAGASLTQGIGNAASGGGGGGSSSGGGGSYGGGSGGKSSGSSGAGATGIMADRMAQSRSIGQRAVGNSFSDDVQLNASGKTATKFANWVDGDHTTKAGQNFANAANKMREGINRMNGYDGTGNNVTSIGQDAEHFRNRVGGEMRNHSITGASAFGTGMGGVGRAALKVGTGLATAGLAFGTSSFDGVAGSQMMRKAGAQMSDGFGEGYNAIKTAAAMNEEDKKMKQEWKNRGILNVRDNVTTFQKEYDARWSDEKNCWEGEAVKHWTADQKEFANKQMLARIPDSDMSEQERAFHLSYAAKNDIHFGKTTADGNLVIECGKASLERNHMNPLDAGLNGPLYREQPKTPAQKLAEQKAEAEIYDMNNMQYEGKNFHKSDGGIYIPGQSGKNPGVSVSQLQNPASNPAPNNFEQGGQGNPNNVKAIIIPGVGEHIVKPRQNNPAPQQPRNPMDALNNPQQTGGNGGHQEQQPQSPIIQTGGREYGSGAEYRKSQEGDANDVQQYLNQQNKNKPNKPDNTQEEPKKKIITGRDYVENQYASSDEIRQLITSGEINSNPLYGNSNPNEFQKGTNPRTGQPMNRNNKS